MNVQEIMTTKVRCAAPDTKLDQVARMMRDEDVGSVPVLDGDILCGIITDRDIVIRCIAEEDDPTDVTAEDILSGHVRTIEPDADVEEAARIMAEEQIRRLPVCKNGRLVGMVSLGDIAVKTDDPDAAADTLEDVSEGVKATRPGQRGQSQVRAPQSAAVHQGGRLQRMEEEAGRRGSAASAARGRARSVPAADVTDAAEIDRKIDAGRQGIASHSGREEQQRQAKVVPIRNQEKPSKTHNASAQKKGRASQSRKRAS